MKLTETNLVKDICYLTDLSGKDVIHNLDGAMNTIGKRRKLLVRCRYYHQYTLQRCADIEDVSKERARVLILQGVQRLRLSIENKLKEKTL